MRTFHLFILVLLSLTFYSCLKTDEPNAAKLIEIRYLANEVSQSIILNSDTLTVQSVKFYVNSFNVTTQNSQAIASNVPLIFDYDDGSAGFPTQVIISELGFLNIGGFNSVDYFFDEIDAEVSDPDLRVDSTSYTGYISGQFNNSFFEIRSAFTDSVKFNYEPVNLSNDEETLRITLSSTVSDFFVENGSLLNPSEQADIDQIFENLINTFDVRVESTTSFIQF